MSLHTAIVGQFKAPHGAFGALAGWIMAQRPSNRLRNEWTVAQLAPLVGVRVLEIGCGPGYGVEACLRAYPDVAVTALDHSELMIAQAEARNAHAVAAGRATFMRGSLEMLSGAEGRFAAAYSCNVLQFFDDKRAALGAIHAALAPGGMIATTFQPRTARATVQDARRWGSDLAVLCREVGFLDVEVRELALRPVSAVCLLSRKRGAR